ncbi:MAG: hypothetical protein WHT65_05885 [Pseudothermotoga sp.]
MVLSLLIFLIANLAFSQGTFSLRLDPMVVTKNVSQGDKFSYNIFLENADEFNPVGIEVLVADVVQDIEGNYNVAQAGTTNYSAAKWIKVSPATFTLQPAGGQIITVEVTVPRGIVGGRYAAIVFRIVPPSQKPEVLPEAMGIAAQFQFQLPSFLELVVEAGRKRMEAYATEIEVQKITEIPSLAEIMQTVGKDANVFSATVVNKSNIHVEVTGELTIKTKEGRTIAKMPLGAGRGVILPEAKVKIRSITLQQLPAGTYTAKGVIYYGGHRPAIIETQFTIEEGSAKISQTKASEAPMFYIEPGNIELKALPGTFRSTTVQITNRGQQAADITTFVYPLEYDEYGELVPIEERTKAPEWVEINPGSFQLKPNQSRRIRITANPPKEALGGYYFDIVFSSATEAIKTEFGANLLVYVGSDETIVKKLTADFQLIKLTESGLEIDLMVKNDGTVHLLPSITIGVEKRIPPKEEESGIILPATTQRLATASYTEETPILPGTERFFGVAMPIQLEPGEYDIVARIDFGANEPILLRGTIKIEGGEGK